MRITPDHRAIIADAIAAAGYDTDDIRDRYRARDIPRGALVQDIDKRFRWDLFHASGLVTMPDGSVANLCGMLYDAGYNDVHIDTALRSIVAPL
jgi:hypothetical protein